MILDEIHKLILLNSLYWYIKLLEEEYGINGERAAS